MGLYIYISIYFSIQSIWLEQHDDISKKWNSMSIRNQSIWNISINTNILYAMYHAEFNFTSLKKSR